MKIDDVSSLCREVVAEVSRVIVGKDRFLEHVIVGILSNAHLLFEDYPGLAKTLTAKSFAAALGCRFARIQFTPDLLPADITGTYVFNMKNSEFTLRQGPIFTNILLADEINRSPPKTQAALLEAMQERQTTLDGHTHKLEDPFIVLATENPLEFEGTYPLPEAQVDRFIARLNIGYPDHASEVEILRRRVERQKEDAPVNQVADAEKTIEMQRSVETVHVDDDLMGYMTEIVHSTRTHRQVELGASPRGSLALLKLSRALAAFHGRDYVTPDDVKEMASEALAHRIILKPEAWARNSDSRFIIEEVLKTVPVPKGK